MISNRVDIREMNIFRNSDQDIFFFFFLFRIFGKVEGYLLNFEIDARERRDTNEYF